MRAQHRKEQIDILMQNECWQVLGRGGGPNPCRCPSRARSTARSALPLSGPKAQAEMAAGVTEVEDNT